MAGPLKRPPFNQTTASMGAQVLVAAQIPVDLKRKAVALSKKMQCSFSAVVRLALWAIVAAPEPALLNRWSDPQIQEALECAATMERERKAGGTPR